MKIRHSLFLVLALSSATWARAQITITQSFSGLNFAIPDNKLSGVSDSRTINTLFSQILDVNITLSITGTGFGAFNGDYYVYLTHESGFAVLLNRPGRRADNLDGYDDNGFANVRFDDEAAADIHNYRLPLTGDHSMPLTGPLTGSWIPDGRATFPTNTLDTDLWSLRLDQFDNLNPNGEWTLFVADTGPGGIARLDGWALEITVIPEPSTWMLALAGALSCAAFGWKRRITRRRSGSSQKHD